MTPLNCIANCAFLAVLKSSSSLPLPPGERASVLVATVVNGVNCIAGEKNCTDTISRSRK